MSTPFVAAFSAVLTVAAPLSPGAYGGLTGSQVGTGWSADRARTGEGRGARAVALTLDGSDMSAMELEGVEDPFPEQNNGPKPRNFIIPGALGVVLGAAGIVLARLALLPDCGDERDVATCKIPQSGDIGARGGRVFGVVGFGVGGAAFGAVSGRSLGNWLREHPDMPESKKQRIALGAGASTVAVGASGLLAGSVLLGLGVSRSVDTAESFTERESGEFTDEEIVSLQSMISDIRMARAGLMLIAFSPTLLAFGAGLLHRRPRRVTVSTTATATEFGVGLSGRF